MNAETRPSTAWLATAAGVTVVAVVWIVGGRIGWADGMVVTPAEAVRPILGPKHELYLRALRATTWAAARGLAIGGGSAFLAAVGAAVVPAARQVVGRLAAVANSAPWVAVAPCLLVVLGRDRGPTAVAAIAVFFYVFVATSLGLAGAPAASHDLLHAFGASRLRRLWTIQLPACWPSLVDGLQLAAPAALAGAIFGEWYGAPRGLGVLLIGSMQTGRADRLWAASVLSAGCSLLAFGGLTLTRRTLVRRYGASIAGGQRALRSRPTVRRVAAELAATIGFAAAAVALWWTWVDVAHVSPLVVPRPARVWADLTGSTSAYVSAAGSTLLTAAIALLAGAALGLVAALAAARLRIVAGIAVPVVVLLAATPLVALFPLAARVIGYQPATVRVLAATMVFFPVFVYTRSGLRAASPAAVDVVHAFGATATGTFRHVLVPAAVPHIASGVRVAAGSAVIAAVVGESLIGRDGLGVQFSYAYRLLQLPRAFGAAIVIVVVSLAVFALAGAAERAVHSRWT
jgi:ABC-type nitrate/sulfonate/bicarbonate transport system permease component